MKNRYANLTREQLEERCARLEQFLRGYDLLVEKIDRAMTPQDVIDKHTKEVGGFVSSLNITKTAKEIVDRAIELIDKLK